MTNQGLPPPINITDMYLAALIDEIKALRADLTPAAKPEAKDGDVVELREPAKPESAKRLTKAKRS